jgi:serine phosphatase RsbU (regulator of sigma subunit)
VEPDLSEIEMNQPQIQASSPASSRLERLVLNLTRLAWLLTSTLAVSVFFSTAPARNARLARLALVHEPSIESLGMSMRFFIQYSSILDTLIFAIFVFLGMVVVIRKFNDRYAVFMSALLIMLGTALTRPYDSLATAPASAIYGLLVLDGLVTAAIIYYLYSFPNGVFQPSWLRWVALGWVVLSLYWYVWPILANPETAALTPQPAIVFFGWIAGGILAAIYRYRKTFDRTQRQQTKWLVFGSIVAGTGFFIQLYLIPLLFPQVSIPSPARVAYVLVGSTFLYLTMLAFPISMAFSILRYRLWDIDLIIRRTIVYAVVTALLTLVFIFLVAGLQQLIYRPVGQPPVLVVALSTLAVSLLFTPLRQGTQRFIDRRFYRARIDQARLLNELAANLRHKVDLTEIADEIISAVTKSLHPQPACLWLYPPEGQGEPVSHPGVKECGVPHPKFVDQLQTASSPLDILELDPLNETTQELAASGILLVVPLISQDEVVGTLNLGRRLSEQEYSANDRDFLGSLASQVAPALRAAQLAYQQRLAALERQRMETEISMGRDVQRTLLPETMPDMPGWAVASHYQPARAMGGDFYDLFSLANGRVGVVIGDVSSKGIPAALVMSSTRSLVRTVAQMVDAPGEVLFRVNELLAGDIPRGMFVTCLYAILDPTNGEVIFANAGHNLPQAALAGETRELRARGMPLGMLPGMKYEESQTQIPPAETVLFYSDGLVEAHAPNGEMFATSRLREYLAGLSIPGAVIPTLLDALADFCGPDQEQEDDITLLVLHRQQNSR